MEYDILQIIILSVSIGGYLTQELQYFSLLVASCLYYRHNKHEYSAYTTYNTQCRTAIIIWGV